MIIIVGVFFVIFFMIFLRKEYPGIFTRDFWVSLFSKNDRAAVFQKTVSFKIRFFFFVGFVLVTAFGVYMSWQYYRYITTPKHDPDVVIVDASVLDFSNKLFLSLLPTKKDPVKYRDYFDTCVLGFTSKDVYRYLAEKENVDKSSLFFSDEVVFTLIEKKDATAKVLVVFYLCTYPENKTKELREKYEVVMDIILQHPRNMPFNSTVLVKPEYTLASLDFKKHKE